jgi:hypothetical protein
MRKGDAGMTKHILIAIAAAATALAGIDGTVVNRTTGKPQANVILQLLQPSQQGMQTLGTARSGAGGAFHFDQEPPGPKLVQAIYGGVLYSHMIPPGTPTSGVEVPVYDATKNRAAAHLAEHMMLLQPSGTDLAVSETFVFQNTGKETFNDPAEGSARFETPGDLSQNPTVQITPPGGMPITRPAEAGRQKRTYRVDYPINPGETHFDIAYTLPAASELSCKVLETSAPLRLVVPNGVTLTGANLEPLGQEPSTQAIIYNVKGNSFTVKISGTGSLGQPDAAASDEDTGQPRIQEVAPRLYDNLYMILALSFGILILGSILLYRRGAPKGGQ